MPGAASPKREREYEELKETFEGEGGYVERQEEVLVRKVDKEHPKHSATKKIKGRSKQR